jgi:hypothetical protein
VRPETSRTTAEACTHADRRRRDVLDVQARAEALEARGQQVLDRSERRRFEQVDHHRRREHVHPAAADARGGVLFADDHLGDAAETGRDLH